LAELTEMETSNGNLEPEGDGTSTLFCQVPSIDLSNEAMIEDVLKEWSSVRETLYNPPEEIC
jgi:hypothetical protein